MQVGIELYVQRAVTINPGYFIGMKLYQNKAIIKESLSKDTFDFSGTLLSGKRLAGTGREKVYTYRDLTGIFEADPASDINFIFIDPEDDIKLEIDTNIWLDPGMMVQDTALRVYSPKKMLEIPMNRPDIKLDWSGRGRYTINVGDFIKELYSDRCKV